MISKNKINLLVNENSIIVPEKIFFPISNLLQYSKVHNEFDILKAREIVNYLHPLFSNHFNLFLECNYIHPANMFITTKRNFLTYCNWLFPILDELMCQIDSKNRINYQQRFIGYLSERLFNVWLLKESKNLKVIEMPLIKFNGAKN